MMTTLLKENYSQKDAYKKTLRFFRILLKTQFLTGLLFLSMISQGTNYYISNSGNDSNSGTTPENAWKTLDKVNSFTPSPGDKILFNRGDEWVGEIRVKTSGSAGSPITYGAYGSGSKPKIYGSEIITGWTQHSGNIYKATVSATAVNQVFIDGKRAKSARYPNSGYFDITKTNSSTSFTSNQLNSGLNYKGATLITRTREWAISTLSVTGSSGQTINVNSAPQYNLDAGEGFVLFNKLEFLDTAGEWYYDKNSGTLYLWATSSNSPDNHLIRASTHKNAIVAEGKNHITIENMELLHSNSDGIYLNGCDYITINNNAITLPDAIAIEADASSSNNHIITNNTIDGANHEGICLKGSSHTISNNIVENINLFKNIGVSGVGAPMGGRGIYVSYGKNNVIKYNKLQNIGYNGIQMFDAPYTTIENNVVKNACLIKEDGGGIYCFNASETNPGCEYSVVRGNIIDNVQGTGEGYNTSNRQGCGIYMDDRIHNVKIENNTVSNVSYYGIYLHNNKYIDVTNNTIFDTGSAYRATGSFNATANTIKNNIIVNVAKSNYSGTSAVLGMLSSKETSIVDIDQNIYVDHHRDKPLRDMSNYTYKTFSEWKSVTGKDKNSKYNGSKLAEGEYEKLFYNDTKQNKTISLGSSAYRDIYGNSVSGSITLEPFTSKILITANKETSVDNQYPSIQNQTFEISGDIQLNEFVGQVNASDPDAGQILNYAIVSGNNEGLFYINESTGEIYTKTGAQITENKSVVLLVEVTDNAANPLSSSANVTINITAVDATPTVDTTAPTVSSFSVPSTSSSLTVAVSSFEASDNQSLAGYLLTETLNTPLANDPGWAYIAPTEYTFANEGTKTLYAWAKDASGNVSTSLSKEIVITLPDMSSTFSEYKFEEPSGNVAIDSECTNDGTIINEHKRIPGIKGNGLELSGTGYISMGQCYGANVQNEVTLSAWIKPDVTSMGYQGIIMHGGPNIDTYALYLYNNTKSIGFKTTGTSSAWSLIDNVNTLWDGEWHHLTVTYDGAEKIFYLDSEVLLKVPATGRIESGEGYNLYVGAGRDENPSSLLYNGLIDEVRIYNYALTQAQVSELYNINDTTIKETVYTEEEISICEGENYNGWATSGQYKRTLASSTGGDSIVTTNLTVNPTYNITEKITINDGEEYNGWTTSGEYQRVLSSVFGCDSIVTTNLTVIVTETISTFSEYLFEENAGALVVDSKGSNDGTIINEELRTNGANGRGLEFTGSGYVNIGQAFGANVQNEVTLSAWIKPDATSLGYQGIIMHGGPNIDTYALYIYNNTKRIGFKTTGTSSAWTQIDNVNTLWDGEWHLLTVTYDGTEKIIYLDNEVLLKVPATGTIESGKGYNLIMGAGRDENPSSLFYNGAIDEVRIYNYALTSDQINELYNLINSDVNETIYTQEEISICEGENYEGWTESGQYERTLVSSTGVDSIVTTNLTVNSVYNITEDITINEGENYNGWSTSGQYQRILSTIYGCDSVVVTNLKVIVTEQTTVYYKEDIYLCEGEDYQGWTESGQYERTLTSSTGSDSIVTTNITVNPAYNISEDITINEGEEYNGWSTTGQYERVLTTILGCDSVVITNLNVIKKELPSSFSEYLFEETSGETAFDSKGSNDGTIMNEEIRVDGVNGSGLEFTGSGYINLGQSFGNIQAEVTLSAWINPNDTKGNYQGIIMHGGPNIDTYALYIHPNFNRIAFKTTGTTSEWTYIDDVNTLWDGNWHLLTVTYNGEEKVIYLDGEILFTESSTGKIESGEGYNLLVGAGRDEAKPKLLYEGQIDEVRIYDYALAASDINLLYDETKGVNIKVGKMTTESDFIEESVDFSVYPNPATSYINVDYSFLPETDTKIQVVNASGQIVRSYDVQSATQRIDLNGFPSGLYYIRSINGGQQVVKKIIKN